MIGKKFGRLTVTGLSPNTSGKRKRLMYYCDCDCGTKNIEVIGEKLRSGSTRSCGCLRKETSSKTHKKYNQYDLSGECGVGLTSNTNKKFLFDLDDYEKIKNYCWFEVKNGYIATSVNNEIDTYIYLHRFIMDAKPEEIVDHIKHNLKDNRKSELRICNQSENMMNSNLHSNNTSGITGVSYDTSHGYWVSEIHVYKKKIILGQFNNKDDAIKARRDAEEKYFGNHSFKNSMGYYNNEI